METNCMRCAERKNEWETLNKLYDFMRNNVESRTRAPKELVWLLNDLATLKGHQYLWGIHPKVDANIQ